MPEKSTVQQAQKDLREGKSPTTAAGEFVREEIEHVKHGKHGVRSPKQAIAIGLSKARRAGVPLAPPPEGKAKEKTRESAERDYRAWQSSARKKPSPRRSRARLQALKREPKNTVSHRALSRQARSAAHWRAPATSRGNEQGPIDLNHAGQAELMRIPNFGAGRVRDLLETRKRIGQFESWEDVKQAPGFGEGMVRRLQQAGVTLGRKLRAA